MVNVKQLKLAFLGGTGRMGSHLAIAHANAGFQVLIGSRQAEKAVRVVEDKLKHQVHSGMEVKGTDNETAAREADVVYWVAGGDLQDRHNELHRLAPVLRDKIIVDVTNILYFYEGDHSKWGQVSSVLQNREVMGVPARWCCAWKSVFHKRLAGDPGPPPRDNPLGVFVNGDDPQAVKTVMAIINEIPGFKAIDAGDLEHSKLTELLGPTWLMDLDKHNAGGKFTAGWRFGI